MSPMVVPRSSTFVASDDESTLYAVTTFKKHSAEFIHKCREHRWIPRDYKYVEGNEEKERRDLDKANSDARRLWGETLRLARTGWSEAVMAWVHVLVLRVFVETVLRYGLPLDFVCALIKVGGFYLSYTLPPWSLLSAVLFVLPLWPPLQPLHAAPLVLFTFRSQPTHSFTLTLPLSAPRGDYPC